MLLEYLIRYGAYSIIIITPLLFGSVHTWAYSFVEILIWIFLLIEVSRYLWNKKRTDKVYIKLLKCPFYFVGIIFICIGLLQLIPLPLNFIQLVSPKTAFLYHKSFDIVGIFCKFKSISLVPYRTRIELLKIATYFVYFLLLFYVLKDFSEIKKFSTFWLVIGVVEGLFGIFQWVNGVNWIWGWKNPYYNGMSVGTFIYHNHYGAFLELCIFLALARLLLEIEIFRAFLSRHRQKSWKLKIAYFFKAPQFSKILILGLIMLIICIALILSGSRGAVLSFLLSFSIISIYLLLRRNIRKYGIIIICVLISILFYCNLLEIKRVIRRFNALKQAYESRLLLTKATLKISKDFVLTGTGLGTYEYICFSYRPAQFKVYNIIHAHNDWLEFISEIGLPFFIISVAGFIFFLCKGVSFWLKRKNPYSKWIGFGCLGSIISLLIHALGDFVFHCPAVFLGLTAVSATFWRAVYMGKEDSYSHHMVLSNKSFLFVCCFIVLISLLVLKQISFHFIAQKLVLTERNSVVEKKKDFHYKVILKAISLEDDNSNLWNLLSKKIIKDNNLYQDVQRWLKKEGYLKDDINLDRIDMAIWLQKKAILNNPVASWYYVYYAWLLLWKGNVEKAKQSVRFAISLDPQYEPWKKYLLRLNSYY